MDLPSFIENDAAFQPKASRQQNLAGHGGTVLGKTWSGMTAAGLPL
jgi:hypothetical protein